MGGVTLDELRQEIVALANGGAADETLPGVADGSPICDPPAPRSEAQVILLATSHGEALSTVALTGQGGLTKAARVIIEPGDAPLYMIAASNFATIWQFEGEVDRIEWAVAGTLRNEHAGVVNVPSDHVSLEPPSACLPDWINEPWGREAGIVAGQLARAIGREQIDHQVASLMLDRVVVLSGRIIKEEEPPGLLGRLVEEARGPDGRPRVHELELVADWPVVEIEPNSVVGSAAADPYELLSSDAGLLQFLIAGALKPIGDQRFHVVQPFQRFPPRLLNVMGGIVIAPGIPLPDGDPGSWVFLEATGECLSDLGCGI